jgi:DNA-binding NtrC family response regulator
MCSPSLCSRPNRPEKKILLIDHCQATRNARASVLRNRGIEVHAADSLQAARFLWQPNLYHFILLDVRRHPPGEALEFYEQIRIASPNEHFIFLIGPPAYISLSWPDAVTATEQEPQQRAERNKRFLAAA